MLNHELLQWNKIIIIIIIIIYIFITLSISSSKTIERAYNDQHNGCNHLNYTLKLFNQNNIEMFHWFYFNKFNTKINQHKNIQHYKLIKNLRISNCLNLNINARVKVNFKLKLKLCWKCWMFYWNDFDSYINLTYLTLVSGKTKRISSLWSNSKNIKHKIPSVKDSYFMWNRKMCAYGKSPRSTSYISV